MSPAVRGRTVPVVILATVTGVLAAVALAVAYIGHALFDADEFADRASSALRDKAVSDQVATRVADELVAADPDLVAFKPVLESVIGGIVRGGAFQSFFRAGVSDMHRAVFEGDENTLTLTLVDIGATVRGVVQAVQPGLAKQIPSGADVELVDGEAPAPVADLARIAEAVRWLPLVLAGMALLCAFGAVRLASDPRSGALAVGVALTICAALALVTVRGGEALVLGQIDDQQGRDAAKGVWDAFLGDLRTAIVLLAGVGAVVAAAASSLLRPVDLRARLEQAWELVARVPERRVWRLVRALALIAGGVLIILRNEAFVALVATFLGLFVAYAGVAELMRLTIAAPAEAEEDRRRGRAALLVSGLGAAVVLGAGLLFVGTGGLSERSLAVESTGCNGSEELCDRPFDEVAIPATHNAMSAATNPGWLFAQQEKGFADQLRDGIRGLMIDAHYGVETEDGTIKTDLSDLTRGERATYDDELGSDAVEAALRIRDRVVSSPEVGEPGVYLCHRFCELGALPIGQAFGDIRDFLAANPEEFVVVVIEDYVDPAEIAVAADSTGLLDYIYKGPAGAPWPTLGEMIGSGGRVLMLAEKDAGDGEFPWYHLAYEELVQETPYSFKQPALLTKPENLTASCKPNRGPPDASLFLVNHWIDTSPAPQPSNAAKVNTREALLDRVHHCERQRELLANLIAVDFYLEGDLFGAIAALNAAR